MSEHVPLFPTTNSSSSAVPKTSSSNLAPSLANLDIFMNKPDEEDIDNLHRMTTYYHQLADEINMTQNNHTLECPIPSKDITFPISKHGESQHGNKTFDGIHLPLEVQNIKENNVDKSNGKEVLDFEHEHTHQSLKEDCDGAPTKSSKVQNTKENNIDKSNGKEVLVFEHEHTHQYLKEDCDGATTKSSKKRNSEQKRRKLISEKIQILQHLIPNSDKTDQASILNDTINYIKSLKHIIEMGQGWSAQNQLQQVAYSVPTYVPVMMKPNVKLETMNVNDNGISSGSAVNLCPMSTTVPAYLPTSSTT